MACNHESRHCVSVKYAILWPFHTTPGGDWVEWFCLKYHIDTMISFIKGSLTSDVNVLKIFHKDSRIFRLKVG